MLSPAPTQLEITDREGKSSRVSLSEGSSAIIGRVEESSIRIAHETISKRHAEVFRDPFGRWWIRDLGSRNGIRVNGMQVPELILSPNVRVRLGDFYLRLHDGRPIDSDAGEASRPPHRRSRPPTHMQHAALTDERPTSLSTLGESPLPKLSAQQLSHALDLGRWLLDLPDAQQRRQALCGSLVNEIFRAKSAMILRLVRGEHGPAPQIFAMVDAASIAATAQAALAATGQPGAAPAATARPAPVHPAPHVSATVLTKMMQVMQPVLASNAPVGPVDARLSIARSLAELTVIACPLRSDDATVDALYVHLPPQCGTPEWLALLALCAGQYQQAESVWTERDRAVTDALIDQELLKAQQIQRKLVPSAGNHPMLDIGIGFRPCRWVGGDYLDVLHSDDGSTLLVTADVCGKGLQAALVAVILHSIVHTRMKAASCPSLTDVMHDMNRYLLENFTGLSWATFVAAKLDHSTGNIECVNAGHLPPTIVGTNGEIRKLKSGIHLPLGLEEQQWECEEAQLAPGEWLVLATDGVTELSRPDGSFLGQTGWENCISESLAQSAEPYSAADVARLLETKLDVISASATPQDDQTFLLVRRRS